MWTARKRAIGTLRRPSKESPTKAKRKAWSLSDLGQYHADTKSTTEAASKEERRGDPGDVHAEQPLAHMLRPQADGPLRKTALGKEDLGWSLYHLAAAGPEGSPTGLLLLSGIATTFSPSGTFWASSIWSP